MKSTEEAKIILALQNLKQMNDEMAQFVELMAKLHKKYYDSLINEGFSKNEAIELVKSMGFNLTK